MRGSAVLDNKPARISAIWQSYHQPLLPLVERAQWVLAWR